MEKRVWFVLGIVVGFLILFVGRNQMLNHDFMDKAIEFFGLLVVLVSLSLFMKTKSND